MEQRREKSGIEIIIEKRLTELNIDLMREKRTQPKYRNDDEIEYISNEIAFMRSLLNYFKELEDKSMFGEVETYDKNLMRYILENLPPQMADKLNSGMRNDTQRLRQNMIVTAEEEKKKKLDSIVSRNAHSVAEQTHHKKGNTPLFITNLKNKIKNSQKNDRQKQRNKNLYSDILEWIERNYVSRYSQMPSGKSYYILKANGSQTKKYNSQDENEYKKFSKQKNEEIISDEIVKIQELLLYSTLSDEIEKNLQNYLDLLKENSKVNQLIKCVNDLSLNSSYIETHKEKEKINKELQKILKKNTSSISKFKEKIDINKLYNNKKDEIEKRKHDAEKQKKVEKELEAPMVDHAILIANKNWEDDFIQEYINKEFGRVPTTEEHVSEKYYEARSKARIMLKQYLDEINTELRNYLVTYLERELANYVTDNYQINNEKEIEFLVSDAMLSPSERYIRDMVEAKRMPKGTKVEDLTSKDFEQIEKHKDRFHDDECDKKIQELSKRIKTIKETHFTSIYKIEDMINIAENIKHEVHEFEEAKKYFGR